MEIPDSEVMEAEAERELGRHEHRQSLNSWASDPSISPSAHARNRSSSGSASSLHSASGVRASPAQSHADSNLTTDEQFAATLSEDILRFRASFVIAPPRTSFVGRAVIPGIVVRISRFINGVEVTRSLPSNSSPTSPTSISPTGGSIGVNLGVEYSSSSGSSHGSAHESSDSSSNSNNSDGNLGMFVAHLSLIDVSPTSVSPSPASVGGSAALVSGVNTTSAELLLDPADLRPRYIAIFNDVLINRPGLYKFVVAIYNGIQFEATIPGNSGEELFRLIAETTIEVLTEDDYDRSVGDTSSLLEDDLDIENDDSISGSVQSNHTSGHSSHSGQSSHSLQSVFSARSTYSIADANNGSNQSAQSSQAPHSLSSSASSGIIGATRRFNDSSVMRNILNEITSVRPG
ncbi:uncharacterized protein V1510DRAFT_405762 [Dipodascopsis tothii]|uniref:uncharacterized protein n=1 Tax=Dipodascopsis tothii TaxID=44089 RepID=UPI0034CF0686